MTAVEEVIKNQFYNWLEDYNKLSEKEYCFKYITAPERKNNIADDDIFKYAYEYIIAGMSVDKWKEHGINKKELNRLCKEDYMICCNCHHNKWYLIKHYKDFRKIFVTENINNGKK